MSDNGRKRERLERLLDLAQVYRGWNRKELAAALGRDPTKLVPGSGNPKLDLVMHLAEALDWSIGDVSECLLKADALEERAGRMERQTADSFDDLDALALDAHEQGRYRDMIKLADTAYDIADSPTERALACIRSFGGWDGLGRYGKSLEAAQRGLMECPIDDEIRRALQSNLANAYYTLWHLVEARATSLELIENYSSTPPRTVWDRCSQAFAHYVLGNTYRRLIGTEPAHAASHADSAIKLLTSCKTLSSELASEAPYWEAVARTAEGGILESRVVTGEHDARSALADITDALGDVVDLEAFDGGDAIESHGWWCIYGCNIAIRHISDERDLQRYMALFTNKADEIANKLDNWSMRERVFSMQYHGHRRFVGWTGQEIPMTIDSEDIKMITGTMGRFPRFRRTGWNILQSANVVQA